MKLGVVTGCDVHHEWFLPWWYKHFRQHNPKLDVSFADFGMSENMRKWAKDNGDVIDITENINKKNWFKKPTAVLKAPYDRVIFMDNDCQVFSDVAFMFKYADDNCIGLTRDIRTQFNTQHTLNPMATGVVVADTDNELIQEWDNLCMRAKKIRGDQEVMNYILAERVKAKNGTTRVTIMPPECQWLRLQGQRKDVHIMHWTGPQGKMAIKVFMRQEGMYDYSR
jgi:hypothetical protein